MKETTRLVRVGLPEPPEKLAPGGADSSRPDVCLCLFHARRSSRVRVHLCTISQSDMGRIGTCTGNAGRRHGANFSFWNGRGDGCFCGGTSTRRYDCSAFRLLLHDPHFDPGISGFGSASQRDWLPPRTTPREQILREQSCCGSRRPPIPTMDICDIRMLAEAAHKAGALVAVDNTTPTALGQQPSGFGRGHFCRVGYQIANRP